MSRIRPIALLTIILFTRQETIEAHEEYHITPLCSSADLNMVTMSTFVSGSRKQLQSDPILLESGLNADYLPDNSKNHLLCHGGQSTFLDTGDACAETNEPYQQTRSLIDWFQQDQQDQGLQAVDQSQQVADSGQ